MINSKDNIDRMRIASPCPTNWEGMKGDERARYCDLCNLHVYNISEMTNKEVKTLIAKTEGRICARLYKRIDGTVITKDCPVGLRAIRRRVSRVAGVAITAIFSFCMSVMGQSSAKEDKSCPSPYKITIEQIQENHSEVQGVVSDPNGAVVAGADVSLINDDTGAELKTITNDVGTFKFSTVEKGSYHLKVLAAGFQSMDVTQIRVETSKATSIDLQLRVESDRVFIGILSAEPLLDTAGPGLKTSFTPDQATRLPF